MAYLSACDATVKLGTASNGKTHTVPARALMASGLPKGDVVVSVQVPPPKPLSFCFTAKYGPRKHLARPIVSGTALARTTASGALQEITLCMVGVAPDKLVLRTYDGKALNVARWSVAGAAASLLSVVGAELHALIDASGETANASKQYRKDLVEAFLLEFLTRSSALLLDDVAPDGFCSSPWTAQASTAQTYPHGDPATHPVRGRQGAGFLAR